MVSYVEKLKSLFVHEIYFQNELDLEFRLENNHSLWSSGLVQRPEHPHSHVDAWTKVMSLTLSQRLSVHLVTEYYANYDQDTC
jgi:hypothetical protein